MSVAEAFTVSREGEADRFESSKSLGNRFLLFHGSRISNYGGILSQGESQTIRCHFIINGAAYTHTPQTIGRALKFLPQVCNLNQRGTRFVDLMSSLVLYHFISTTGLRIAPPSAPVSGYRFGKGIYFADVIGACRRVESQPSFGCKLIGLIDFFLF
jgi:hypothetical protein